MAEAETPPSAKRSRMATIANNSDNEHDRAAPKCLISTGDTFSAPITQTDDFTPVQKHTSGHSPSGSNCFRNAQLSPDGSSIITHNEDWRLRTFVLPADLLSREKDAGDLTPITTSTAANTYSTAIYPSFNLSDPSTTVLLRASVDLPIRLINALDLEYGHASYVWQSPTTEAYITPHSMIFAPHASHFVAGATEKLALFDMNYDGSKPISEFATRKSKKVRKAYGESEVGLSGLIMALSISNANNLLAAGTTGRQIGLWDAAGVGEKTSSFSVQDDIEPGLKGSGITQLEWSPCGHYLFVAERSSDVLLIFDIRQGRRLGWLKGRQARTPQRLSFSVVSAAHGGCDVWAGGTDGVVRIWHDVIGSEGEQDADSSFKAQSDTITSVMVHPSQTIFATSSGQRRQSCELSEDSESDGFEPETNDSPRTDGEIEPVRPDNSLKVWLCTAQGHE